MKLSSYPVLFIIGTQGSGKSTIAKLIANEVNGIFYEGDDAIPPESEIKKRLDLGLTIFPPQIDEFMVNHFLPAIKKKKIEADLEKKILVVSQGLFFNRHRLLLQNEWEKDTYFLVIETSSNLQAKQITARAIKNGKDQAYIDQEIKSAMKSNPFFEKPDPTLNAFYFTFLGDSRVFLKSFKELWLSIRK